MHVRIPTLVVVATLCAAGVASLACGCELPARSADPQRLPKLPSPRLMAAATSPPLYLFSATPEAVSAKLPAEVMVYSVVQKETTRDAVCELAARAGVPVSADRYAIMPEVVSDGPYYSATVGQMTEASLGDLDVTLSPDGNYMLTIRSHVPGQTEEAGSDEVTKAAAEGFLASSGLLPEGCRFDSVRPGEAIEYTTPAQDGIHVRMIGKAVVYGRYLDGIAGGAFVVRVNGKGEVYHVTRNVRNVAPLAVYPVLSLEEAVEALRSGAGTIVGPGGPGGPQQATIDHVELRYYEGALGSKLEYLEPVYLMSGSVQGYSERFVANLPAIRPEYFAEQ